MHEIDRREIREVICAVCDERQPVGSDCRLCGVSFGAYSCKECNFFDDDTSKQQYHCEHCGICRVGGRENFFHCHTCGSCYSLALRVCPLPMPVFPCLSPPLVSGVLECLIPPFLPLPSLSFTFNSL